MASKDQCERAMASHQHQLSKVKHFNGLGIRPLKTDARESGRTEYAVAVYVTKKVPESMLQPEDIVPKHLDLPGGGEVPTRTIELAGELRRETAIEPN